MLVSKYIQCGCTSIQNGSIFYSSVFKSMQVILFIPLHMNPICLATCSQGQAVPQLFINFSTELSLLWLHRSLTGSVEVACSRLWPQGLTGFRYYVMCLEAVFPTSNSVSAVHLGRTPHSWSSSVSKPCAFRY